METAQFGVIGLGVMGSNLARNVERNGFSVAVYNRESEMQEKFLKEFGEGHRFVGAATLPELVAKVERPRRILIMIVAGPPVDSVIAQLAPHLSPGDILIDGGNSNFIDTQRRCKELASKGILFVGSGVSGGEEGALWGPSLMPGGPREAYEAIAPIWNKIAAQVEDGPCCTYIGQDGSGHFVKMVHNGIEYGDMQLIAEAYDLLRTVLKMKAAELGDVFEEWNKGELQSFLVEITAAIFRRVDDATGRPLVDLVLDKAGQKGTGKWTVESALDLGVPTPALNAAVEARIISSLKEQRVEASRLYADAGVEKPEVQRAQLEGNARAEFITAVRDALYASKICAYAQGMALIQAAGREYQWSLNLGEISRIWKGGCIIRAQFLNRIKEAYARRSDLPNLLLDPQFRSWIVAASPAWRNAVSTGILYGVPLPAMSASLAYFDSYRRENLPQNLTQAQRDLFGAHTYQRIDQPGSSPVHSDWIPASGK